VPLSALLLCCESRCCYVHCTHTYTLHITHICYTRTFARGTRRLPTPRSALPAAFAGRLYPCPARLPPTGSACTRGSLRLRNSTARFARLGSRLWFCHRTIAFWLRGCYETAFWRNAMRLHLRCTSPLSAVLPWFHFCQFAHLRSVKHWTFRRSPSATLLLLVHCGSRWFGTTYTTLCLARSVSCFSISHRAFWTRACCASAGGLGACCYLTLPPLIALCHTLTLYDRPTCRTGAQTGNMTTHLRCALDCARHDMFGAGRLGSWA